jgi:exodeoxyribonuclease VII small subunit
VKLEETFLQIEDIIRQMESPEVSLDESFSLYQSGVGKIRDCNVMLDEVEKKMQILNADGTIGEME